MCDFYAFYRGCYSESREVFPRTCVKSRAMIGLSFGNMKIRLKTLPKFPIKESHSKEGIAQRIVLRVIVAISSMVTELRSRHPF